MGQKKQPTLLLWKVFFHIYVTFFYPAYQLCSLRSFVSTILSLLLIRSWQISIPRRMDKKPLLNHKNSHRFLSPFRCINWEHFASFCNFVHLFFLKIRFPPWSDHYWVWCCCFWDHCLSLEHHIESAAGGKLLRLFWSKRTHQFPRYLVPYLLSCSPKQRCQTRTWKGWFNIWRSHFQKRLDPWTW